MTRFGLLTITAALALSGMSVGSPRARPTLHEIAMVEKGQYGIAFEPQRLTGHPGDTLRFIQRGALPHDVRLRSRPDEAKLPESLGSELLTERGATWEMVLDERFAPGKYFFVCTPHEVMGMAFILYLEPAP